MPRNIVILLDGTSNQISGDRTNVLRLYGSLERSARQVVFYEPGVGSFGLSGWWRRWQSKARIVLGLANGAGIGDIVERAYRFLVENWQPDDRIYLIGFSRGAYTARLLAGFLRIFGLIRPEQLNLLRYAWRAYVRLGQPESQTFSTEISHYQKVLRGRAVRIEFLGLWDTVASIFDHTASFPWLTTTQKAYTNRNERVRRVRHALAIDERRTYFQPSLWEPGQHFEAWSPQQRRYTRVPQDFEEVWFTGCHTDIGGGNPEAESGLAKIPLEWLYREASAAGILGREAVFERLALGEPVPDRTGSHSATEDTEVEASPEAESVALDVAANRPHKAYTPPDPLAAINNSMNFAWATVEFLPRKIPKTALRRRPRLGHFYVPLFDHRRIPEGAKLHEVVRLRLENCPDYRPVNLPRDYEFVSTRPPAAGSATTPEPAARPSRT
ncbi:DUF2235 domain-containing protein [Pseudohoeflea coraliihabitans]|uniref:DUF2235 domain-containing protein n=1 Tax=Pseudohoeflea coraliihabitans TaxID=2860393 RepID=A0ABS6WJE5_9HYPH|nr:DUF2235 domain-containing protein [Pseudohoeflea sp. DP4N28-3]